MRINDYRKLWLKLHRSYEKKAFAIFRKGLRDAAKRIPFDNLDALNYKASIQFNVGEEEIKNAYLKTYTTIGILYGNRVGRGINRDIKAFTLDSCADAYKRFLQQWLLNNAGLRIQTVRQSLIDYLIKEIANGMDEGLTIREVAARLEKLVNSRNFYRWQALRIARTETTEKGVCEFQGDFLRFPGDPIGNSANTINCRCSVAIRPKRDSNGRLIRK